jgi:GT2 family glycosyltransferase
MNAVMHVVLVDYFKASRVVEAIKVLREQLYDQSKVFITVIDNSCSAENFEVLKKLSGAGIEIINSEKNIGYISAVNMAVNLRSEPSDIVLLLNPDIILKDKHTLSGMVANFKDPKCYVVGPAQINDDGTIPEIARGYPSIAALIAKRTILGKTSWGEKAVSKYLLSGFDPKKTQAVPWLQSSCVFIRKSYWDKVGGLNPKYFLFMADIEICKKAYEHGGYVIYDSSHIAIADGKRCSDGGVMALFKKPALRKHIIDAARYYIN